MDRLIAIVLLFCFGLLGCSHVVHGRVTGKSVHPAYTWFMPMWISTGKSGMMIMIPMESPESYSIIVTGPDTEGKTVDEELWVSREQLNLIREGDVYTCGGDKEAACITERPAHRKE